MGQLISAGQSDISDVYYDSLPFGGGSAVFLTLTREFAAMGASGSQDNPEVRCRA
jgi:hypothetical protein